MSMSWSIHNLLALNGIVLNIEEGYLRGLAKVRE